MYKFNDKLKGVYSVFEPLIRQRVDEFFNMEQDSIITTPYDYLHYKNNEEHMEAFDTLGEYGGNKIVEMFKTLDNYPDLKYKQSEKNMIASVATMDYTVNHAFLEDMVCMVVDLSDLSKPTELHTRSLRIIEWMKRSGNLELQDYEETKYHLVNGSTRHSMKEGKFSTLRLDVVRNATMLNKFDFKIRGTKPKVHLDLTSENTNLVLIPVPFLIRAYERMVELTNLNIPMFHTLTPSGVTNSKMYGTNKAIVNHIYKSTGKDFKEINERNSTVEPYFDELTSQAIFYDVTAPFDSLGMMPLRLELMDAVTMIEDTNNVDTSLHNIEYDLIKPVYSSYINRMTVAQIDSLGQEVRGFATLEDKKEYMLSKIAEYSNTKIMTSIIRPNIQIFNEVSRSTEKDTTNDNGNTTDTGVERLLGKRLSVTPKVLKNFYPLDLSSCYLEGNRGQRMMADIPRIKAIINQATRTGVVKLTMISVKGYVYTRYVSNNYKVMTSNYTYGKNFVKEYETKARKKEFIVMGLRRALEKESTIPLEKVSTVISDYGLKHLLNDTILKEAEIRTGVLDIKRLIYILQGVQTTNDEYNYSNTNSLMTLRDIYAKYSKNDSIIIQVDLNNLLKAEYSILGE